MGFVHGILMGLDDSYPPGNVYSLLSKFTNLQQVNQLFLWAISNSYVKLPEGICTVWKYYLIFF